MTNKNWNTDDYLFEFTDVPAYSGELVHMPIIHKIDKVHHFLFDGVLKDAHRCLGIHAELPALILCLASVDYLAGYYAGKQTDRNDYIGFMRRYFPTQYHSLLDEIYAQLRCGLMHNLVAQDPWKSSQVSFLIHPNSTNHLLMNQNGKTIFSVHFFEQDIYRAWVMYMYDLIMKSDENLTLVNNFNNRFNRLEGRSAFMERVPD